MEDRQANLHAALREAQSKYVYFLLAAAIATVGFALRETSGKALDISQLPLAFAVFLWSGSFFCGCLNLQYTGSNLFANVVLLQIEKREHPDVREYSQSEIEAASSGIRKAFESNSEKAANHSQLQFLFLTLGSLAYISWHVLDMYIRTAMPGYF